VNPVCDRVHSKIVLANNWADAQMSPGRSRLPKSGALVGTSSSEGCKRLVLVSCSKLLAWVVKNSPVEISAYAKTWFPAMTTAAKSYYAGIEHPVIQQRSRRQNARHRRT